FQVEMEQTDGFITVCIPYSTIEPIKGKLYSGFQSEQLEMDSRWTARIHEQLHDMSVNVVVELASTMMNASDVLNLSVGDIITFDKKVTEPLLAKVEGVPKFLGSAGRIGNSKAFQLRNMLYTPNN
ncbi:MAG: flagellar motor switch protein FliM, partial [Deltaproteobacteria bacterium]